MSDEDDYDDEDASPDFDGETYDTTRDHDRLSRQLRLVFTLIQDGQWRTPEDFEARLGERWASVSARLRDLRKDKFGGFCIVRQSLGGGLFRYALCQCAVYPCPHWGQTHDAPRHD